MKTMLKTMRIPKYEIPEDILPVFEHISETYKGNEGEGEFLKAMEMYLTKEQRLRLYEQNGSCNGTGYDKERRAFAIEHAEKPLAERLQLFGDAFSRDVVLNEDNTITVTFACSHGYYKHAPKGKFDYAASLETYFERCAGGRMYELQKALGIKLKIKSVDISSLSDNIINPVVYTYEILD